MGGKTLGELLVDLRDVEGVRGCALSTNDGIIVRSELNGRFRDDVVSGLASFLLSTTRRAFDEAGEASGIDRFVVHATHGKMVIKRVEDAFLIVITDQFARLDSLLRTVDAVAAQMCAASRLDV
ncbi:MAG: roadblock/LC7 domain-containing protein [Planctomycetota bacterium]|nr:roadblock/LC7 domain-containing protein [Planctomycetota bacterium]MDA1221829.1 roadblock/LC7 domain-containing protein [Planctomycetota bacterium]